MRGKGVITRDRAMLVESDVAGLMEMVGKRKGKYTRPPEEVTARQMSKGIAERTVKVAESYYYIADIKRAVRLVYQTVSTEDVRVGIGNNGVLYVSGSSHPQGTRGRFVEIAVAPIRRAK